MDSFDHYTVPGDLGKKYEAVVTTSVTGVAGRTNNCININGALGTVAKTVGEITNKIIVGFGFYAVSGVAAGGIVTINDRQMPNIGIERNADSTISAYRHSGTSAKALLGTSVAAPLGVDAWHYIELKAYRHATLGTILVYVDGIEVLNLSNQNTTSAVDNGAYTAVQFNQAANANDYTGNGPTGHKRFDDFYICDDLNSLNDDFLGQPSIYVVYPNADAAPNEWTPSAGVNHYAMVDEHDIDDDTSYLEVTDADAEELFNLEDSPVLVGSVAAVQVNTVVRRTTPGGATYKHKLQQGVLTALGDELGFPSGSVYSMNSEPFDQDPTDNVDWTFARVNSLIAGVERNA